MPRPILAPISLNSRPGSQLNNRKKNRVIGRYLEGARPVVIVKAEILPDATVRSLLRRFKERGTTLNKLRSGRPLKATRREIRALKRAVV
jgi:transposase